MRLLLSQGVLEDVEGNPELARSLLRRGLLVEPGNAFLLHALGMLEYKAGDIAKAREAFRAAVQANGDHTQSWLAWAQLEEAQGNIDVARSTYVRGCQSRSSRGSVQLWQAWARMEEQHTDGRAALEVYRKAMLLFPNDSQLLVESAKTLAKLGDVAEASTMLRRALDIDAHNPYVYQCLARIEMRQQRQTEALRLFATGVAMAEEGFSKALSADGKERKGSGGGARGALPWRRRWASASLLTWFTAGPMWWRSMARMSMPRGPCTPRQPPSIRSGGTCGGRLLPSSRGRETRSYRATTLRALSMPSHTMGQHGVRGRSWSSRWATLSARLSMRGAARS